MIRPLLASQHETRVQFGIPTNNAIQIQKVLLGLGKDGEHSMIELVKSACDGHQPYINLDQRLWTEY